MPLRVGNGRLNRLLQVKVKVRPVEPLDGHQSPAAGVRRHVLVRRLGDVIRVCALHVVLHRPAALFLVLLLRRCRRRRAVRATQVGNAEDCLPVARALAVLRVVARGSVAEAGGAEGSLGPAVLDVGKVPVDGLGGCVAVELVADVDEGLGGGDVDNVDRGEVEDDGLERGAVVVLVLLCVSWSWVVPRPVLLYC